jgi:hypothetical protein
LFLLGFALLNRIPFLLYQHVLLLCILQSFIKSKFPLHSISVDGLYFLHRLAESVLEFATSIQRGTAATILAAKIGSKWKQVEKQIRTLSIACLLLLRQLSRNVSAIEFEKILIDATETQGKRRSLSSKNIFFLKTLYIMGLFEANNSRIL